MNQQTATSPWAASGTFPAGAEPSLDARGVQPGVPPVAAPPAPSRLVGGVSAGLAARTGAPVIAFRIGWVAATFVAAAVHPVAALVVIAGYGLVWMRTPQARTAEPPEDGTARTYGAAGPAAAVPSAPPRPSAPRTEPPARSREERPYLRDFVSYIWGSNPLPAPTYQTDLTAVVTSGLQLPGTMGIGYYASRMPFGKLYVYPDYLVFLTESHNKPGVIPRISGTLSVLLDGWKAMMFWRPIPLALGMYRRVTTEERDRLRKPLGNPNSIIVPLSEIQGVTTHRYGLMRYAVLHTNGREIMLAPHMYLGCLPGFALVFLLLPGVRRNFAGSLGLPWETELIARLEQAAAARRQTTAGTDPSDV